MERIKRENDRSIEEITLCLDNPRKENTPTINPTKLSTHVTSTLISSEAELLVNQ